MARTAASESVVPKVLSRRVLVNIKRDQTTATPRVVWQHELPILEAIYGEGNIPLVDAETMDEGYTDKPSRELLIYNKAQDKIPRPSEASGLDFVFIGSPAVEYERLVGAYGMHPEVRMSWVENVYGRFQSGRFSAVIGKPSLEDLPEAQLRQLVTDFAGPDVAKKTEAKDLISVAVEAGVEVE